MKVALLVPKNGVQGIMFYADGDRPIMKAYANENDDLHQIYIKAINVPDAVAQVTLGVANFDSKIDENGVKKVLDVNSIIEYVVPRIVTLMARLYVPKSSNIPV